MTNGEDWEEKLIEQLVEMFRNMGMHMDKEQIRGMMEQFRSQFENMGLDAVSYTHLTLPTKRIV